MNSIIGNKYNKLTVISATSKRDAAGAVVYKCKCDCGNITYATARVLKSGHKRSCGCIKKEITNRKDLTGLKFGKLTVIRYVNTVKCKAMWLCKCDCGGSIEVVGESLTSGNTTSCGCISTERIKQLNKDNLVDNTNIAIIKSLVCDNKSKITSSGVKGVGWDKKHNKWRAYIMFKRKSYHLGYFDDVKEAIKARKKAEDKIFKEFIKEHNGGNKNG